jgi:hypothetical protein
MHRMVYEFFVCGVDCFQLRTATLRHRLGG